MKASIFVLVYIFIIFSGHVVAETVPPPQKFVQVIEKLEKLMLDKNIKLVEGEEIRDVVTFGYLNAINERGTQLGHLDDGIVNKTKEWLSIWCWFPIIPESKKKEAEQEIKKVRTALVRGAYQRTLAGLTVVPGFAITSVGEIFPPKQIFAIYPVFGKSQQVFNTVATWPKPPPQEIISSIGRDRFGYKDVINAEWVKNFLK